MFFKRWCFFLFLGVFFHNQLIHACNHRLDGDYCEAREYGYRRTPVNSARINNKECSKYFQEQAKRSKDLRHHLIVRGVFENFTKEAIYIRQEILKRDHSFPESINQGKIASEIYNDLPETFPLKKNKGKSSKNKAIKDIKDSYDTLKKDLDSHSREHNLASFGLIFFDEEGSLINSNPFHFSNCPAYNVEEPFFFLSGRAHRECEASDPSFWTALPLDAPTHADLFDIKNLDELLEKQRGSYGGDLELYHQAVIKNLVNKTKNCPMFHHIKERYDDALKLEEGQSFCPDFLELLRIRVYDLRDKDTKEDWYYPDRDDSNNKKEKEAIPNQEGDFTHSEQYALFQATVEAEENKTYFSVFLDACRKKLLQEGKEVKSYALLLYSYNAMCARCSQSVILDFQYQENSFNKQVNFMLDKLSSELSPSEKPISSIRPMIFLAGYNHLYRSKIYSKQPIDAFEGMMSTGLSDKTCGKGIDCNSCRPEEAPNMIYHYHIPKDQQIQETPFEEANQIDLPSFEEKKEDIDEGLPDFSNE